MSDSNFVQESFLGGEVSPFAQGKISDPNYRKSMNVCRNGYPIAEGAWLRRSGTRFVSTTLNGSPGRIIPFAFEQAVPYYMEFTNGYLRFYATLSGAANVGLIPAVQIATPYVSSAWQNLRNIQSETQTLLLHGSYAPRALNVSTLPTPTAYATFALTTATFTDGPYLDPPTDKSTLTPSAKTGTITLTASSTASINGGQGFLSTDVGRSVRLLSEPAVWAVGTAYVAGNAVTYNGAYFTCIVGNTGQQPDIAIAYWSISTTTSNWSWGTITVVTSTTVVSLLIKGMDLLYTNPVTIWRLGVYSDTTGYPTCGIYYEGRIWLSGAVANRVDASVVNAIAKGVIDMTPTAPDGTVADNNAISYIFNSSEVNPILWMKGEAAGIVCGSQASEWFIRASQLSDPITPTSIQAHEVTTYGSENIEPADCQLTNAFVQRYGRTILEYFPDVFSGRYSAPALSDSAKHLTVSGVKEVRYQQELLPVLWARCGDGSLIGGTYERNSLFSSQGPTFCGWHRHDLGSGRLVESIAVGPSKDGDSDDLVMVTNDPATNVRHVEIMQNIFEVNSQITSGWFLDDAVVPTSGTIIVAGTAGTSSTLTFSGMTHLIGKTVTVWCGGVDCGDFYIADGTVTIPIDSDVGGIFTSAYLAAISSATAYGVNGVIISGGSIGGPYTVPALVGFTYTSQGQILRPDTTEQNRSPTGPGPAKPRRNHQFGALLSGTQGISFGTDFSRLHAAQFKSKGNTPYTALQLFSGVYWDVVDDDYSLDGMLAWQVSRPYPAAVVSISGFLNSQDR